MKKNKIILVFTILFMTFTVVYINNTLRNDNKNKYSLEAINMSDKDKKISEKEAIENVKKYLNEVKSSTSLIVEVDHINKSYYVVHAYEIIKNEEESHTATAGWFNVNMYTGEVIDIIN